MNTFAHSLGLEVSSPPNQKTMESEGGKTTVVPHQEVKAHEVRVLKYAHCVEKQAGRTKKWICKSVKLTNTFASFVVDDRVDGKTNNFFVDVLTKSSS